ncbi:hypothetical protein AA101099_1762 [Neoasaia chiangmaiensis NBRC 101099]|uniref:Uncharacterized protein n=1 Tax=Neoasaia chiangmaiensis TaxID=320497 RepID=A0A1U9KRC5_9PROT|nr:hypothetical protein [Neoasaia chiangmaiensis]AQS88282.1 hypothetical protein A0U93_10380 [Neoasaia chiangmaiensis]GBR39661.1 hypothetical protein AA101099_1762 [Neoasaia chiangmaiensis NBRC 101099]GEN14684.1 hypothetical protein NCH01_11150 [Neoasaia chiangmaiensis]
MGLLKDVSVTNGTRRRLQRADTAPPPFPTATYWRIHAVTVEHGTTPRVSIAMSGYTDKEASDRGDPWCAGRKFMFSAEDLGQADLHTLSTAVLYRAIVRKINAAPEGDMTPAVARDALFGATAA